MKKTTAIISLLFILVSCKRYVAESNVTDTVLNDDYDIALRFLDKKQLDSAFLSFNKAKDHYVAMDDSVQVAKCFLQMAITLNEVSDYLGAEELSFQSLSYLDTSNVKHHDLIAMLYNNLGRSVSVLGNGGDELNYYDQAIKYESNLDNKLVYLNNKAVCFYDLKKYREALDIYEEVLKYPKSNDRNYARVLCNYAKTRWRVDARYSPLPDFWIAKEIRERDNNTWGMNSSYAHLAEYYEKKKSDSAFFYAKRRLDVAQKLNSSQDILNGLTILVRLSPANETKELFKKYKHLQDSVQLERGRSKNQFASIRYDVEKRKVENLRLLNDNTKKAFRITVQQYVIITFFVLATLLGLVGYNRFRRKQLRLEYEANNRIKNNQLKTSRKVHDIVANGLYRVMSEIEYNEEMDREGILDKLEEMYHKSRDISYDVVQVPSKTLSYHVEVAQLLRSFASDRQKVLIVGNEEALWEILGANEKTQLLQVLQELMVNMRKHSEATTVVLRFEVVAQKLEVFYRDNGVGLRSEIKGNGMWNTENRIFSIGGNITFESEEGKGLNVFIQIPGKI